MKRNNIMTGALILSIGGVLAKVFSAIYRIGLTRILGGEGIGIYQLVFPLYSLCVVLATAGLPMAISKIIAKHKNNGKSVVKKCMMFTAVISLVLTLILLLGSKGLASLQGEKSISICYIILAPTIILVSGASVLRGYFQGQENFTPSAVSNIIEQFVKLCVGLVLSLALLNVSLIASIIGAMISIVVSEVVSIIILIFYYRRERGKKEEQINISIKEITKDILPITLTNIIMPIATFIDSVLVVNLLSVNFTSSMSIFLYGLESGAVSSLVSLPTIFSFAIASVILPNIALRTSEFNKNHKLSLALKIVLIISVPCVLCFLFIPDRLIDLLYANRLNGMGVQGLNIAYRLLSISGIGIIFLAVNQVYSSSLQAIDERYVTIRNLIIAVILKFVIELLFMPSLYLNIYSLSIANTVCYVTVMVLNHFEIKEHFNLRINYIFTGKLIVANSLMLLALVGILSVSTSWSNTLLGIVVAAIVYLGSLYLLKIFNKKDSAMMKYKIR